LAIDEATNPVNYLARGRWILNGYWVSLYFNHMRPWNFSSCRCKVTSMICICITVYFEFDFTERRTYTYSDITTYLLFQDPRF